MDMLRKKHFLASPREEEDELLILKHRRQTIYFSTESLSLAICPTLVCNFRCPYCFESNQKDGAFMSTETRQRLIDWIRQHKGIERLTVEWYGGEPLLAFDTICQLTEKFKEFDLKYKAGLVTNGYLLTDDKIEKLNDLNISHIQITLDGPREVHDSRRFLEGGIPTFDRIVDNVTRLMDSDYAGTCDIRVNVDKYNFESYLNLRCSLMKQFEGKKLNVYHGYVHTPEGHDYEQHLCLNSDEWIALGLEMYHKYGEIPPVGIYPIPLTAGMCVASSNNGFLIGPDGELYKCWRDVGIKDRVAGNIHCDPPVTNPALQAQYLIGLDGYNDPECQKCPELPLCGGECRNKRLLNKLHGENVLLQCSVLKGHLPEYLEIYIDKLRSKELCSAMLAPGAAKENITGYRDISPTEVL
jgi:uncharacterized protein